MVMQIPIHSVKIFLAPVICLAARLTKLLDFNFELILWKPTKLIYAAMTYWYAFSGATSNDPSQPDAAKRPVLTLADAQKQSH